MAKAVKTSEKKVAKTKGGPRKPSAYNTFMKSEIARVKADHPDMGHKDIFKKAAQNWRDSPLNPKAAK